MLLGLLADIHEHTNHLRRALDLFAELRVERTIFLGDLFDHGRHIGETCRLLIDAPQPPGPVSGVWGNHDIGLCPWKGEPVGSELAARFPAHVLEVFARLCPTLTIDDCFFQHIEPWLDPCSLEDLWQQPGDLLDPARSARAFAASQARITFMGHHHVWIIRREHDPAPIQLLESPAPVTLTRPHRWFIHAGAVMHGWAATYDTETALLTPLRLSQV